jgi:hypothetical protein
VEGDKNQIHAGTKNRLQHKSKTTQRSKRQVRKASKAPTTVQPARPLQRPASKATTKNGLQALIKAKQRKEASGKSVRPARPLQLFSQHSSTTPGQQGHNQKWAAGPHKSKTTQRSKRQVRKASKTPTTVQPEQLYNARPARPQQKMGCRPS